VLRISGLPLKNGMADDNVIEGSGYQNLIMEAALSSNPNSVVFHGFFQPDSS
jgi:hypothetical protein